MQLRRQLFVLLVLLLSIVLDYVDYNIVIFVMVNAQAHYMHTKERHERRTTECKFKVCNLVCLPGDCRQDEFTTDPGSMHASVVSEKVFTGKMGKRVSMSLECHGPLSCTGLMQLRAATRGFISKGLKHDPVYITRASVVCMMSKIACMGAQFFITPTAFPAKTGTPQLIDWLSAAAVAGDAMVVVSGDIRESVVVIAHASVVQIRTEETELRRFAYPFDQFICNRLLFDHVLRVEIQASAFSLQSNVFDMEFVHYYAHVDCNFDHACIGNMYWMPDSFYVDCRHDDSCWFSSFFLDACTPGLKLDSCAGGRQLKLAAAEGQIIFVICDVADERKRSALCLKIDGDPRQVRWFRTQAEWYKETRKLMGELAADVGYREQTKTKAATKAWVLLHANVKFYAGAYFQAAAYTLAAGADYALSEGIHAGIKTAAAATALAAAGIAVPILIIPGLILVGQALWELHVAVSEKRRQDTLMAQMGRVRGRVWTPDPEATPFADHATRYGNTMNSMNSMNSMDAMLTRTPRTYAASMHLYDLCTGEIYDYPDFEQRQSSSASASSVVSLPLPSLLDNEADDHQVVDEEDVNVGVDNTFSIPSWTSSSSSSSSSLSLGVNDMPVIVNYNNIQLNISHFVMVMLFCFFIGGITVVIVLWFAKKIIPCMVRKRGKQQQSLISNS